MRYEYIFYSTDKSFDYGDFPNSTYTEFENTGFFIEIDKNDNVDISTLEGFGDFEGIEKQIKTAEDLIKFISDNKCNIENARRAMFTYRELLEELIEFLKDNERRKNELFSRPARP